MTRAHAFLRQQQIENNTAIMTASEFAADKRVTGDVEIIRIDRDLGQLTREYRNFLKETFSSRVVDKVFLDSFPVGIVGEFSGFEFAEIEVHYIARRLKWNNYVKFLPEDLPRFKKTFVIEPLEKEHQAFVEVHSETVIDFDLIYQIPESQDGDLANRIVAEYSPFWMVVHAEKLEETEQLINFAREMREAENAIVSLILVSPNNHSFENRFDIYPASALFPFAERIITACGFNSMKQAEPFRDKHFFLPFARRYDDQFARARFARAEQSGASQHFDS